MDKKRSGSLTKPATQEVNITRVFDAPRELVFEAWTNPTYLGRWWGPKEVSKPVCEVDAQPGGNIYIVMRVSDGAGYSSGAMRGTFREVQRPERLGFTAVVEDADGNVHFESFITVAFTDQNGKTVLSIHAKATGLSAESLAMLAGMEESWNQSLDLLARETATLAGRAIVITRVFDAPRDLVWTAWTEPKHLIQWWGPNGFTNTFYEIAVKPGGLWRFIMHGPDGTDYNNRILFKDVVKPEFMTYIHGSDEEPDQFDVTVTFVQEGRKTRVTMQTVLPTAEEKARLVDFGAVEGGKQTLNKLAAHLLTMA